MGRAVTTLMIMAGLMVVFHLFGLIEPGTTPNSVLLQYLLDPSGAPLTSIWATIFGAISLVALTGSVVVGLLTRNIELTVMVTITTFLFTLVWDFLSVVNVIASVSPALAVIVFGPSFFIIATTMVDFWRGRD